MLAAQVLGPDCQGGASSGFPNLSVPYFSPLKTGAGTVPTLSVTMRIYCDTPRVLITVAGTWQALNISSCYI